MKIIRKDNRYYQLIAKMVNCIPIKVVNLN